METLVLTKALTASLVMAGETLALYVYVGAKETFAQQKDYSMDALHLSDMWLHLMNMLGTRNYQLNHYSLLAGTHCLLSSALK